MKAVTGSNSEEVRLIKAVQTAVDAVPDGAIGGQTMANIAMALGAIKSPICVTMYNVPTIICTNIVNRPDANGKPLSSFPMYSISGSFSANYKPCSIAIAGGSVYCTTACHAFDGPGYPESVLYSHDGHIFMSQSINTKTVLLGASWAVGGLGIRVGGRTLNAEKNEGFTGKFSDVLRKTAHTVIGTWKFGEKTYLALMYFPNHSTAEIKAHCEKINLYNTIQLDGGHYAAIKTPVKSVNINQKQAWVICAE